ncbi:hypothetical protein [Thorsellia kenyensis]|uniref:Uncharacterized protein n=1 Tax=Thorsellia kenyensis TaxID=1549888 RepID=A0ABV6CDF3_9GAMM
MQNKYYDDIEQFLDEEDRIELLSARKELQKKMQEEWVVAADEEGNILQINPDGTYVVIRDKEGNIVNYLPDN